MEQENNQNVNSEAENSKGTEQVKVKELIMKNLLRQTKNFNHF